VTRLKFDADGRLLDDGRVLAFVAPGGRADAVGRLVADDVEHAIVAPGELTDWRCDLLDGGGRRTGGFRPFRLRRGGRLRSGETSVSLQGHSWSHDRWSFATPDGRRVEATVERRGGDASPPGSTDVEIALVAEDRADAAPLVKHARVLALGCWLIGQWHALAPGDHMLTSTGAGGELAGASRSSARGGIFAREAN
jgi:hypothetical protein